MTPQDEIVALAAAVRAALAAEPPPPGPHPIDDPNHITAWANGTLPADKRREVARHLSACRECLDAVAELVKAGLLPVPPAEPLATPFRAPRWAVGAGVGVAASVALAVLAVRLASHENPDARELAAATRQVDAGDAAVALPRLFALRDRPLDEHLRSEWASVLERAVYAEARDSLAAGKFDTAATLVARGNAAGADSPRIQNIAGQAAAGDRREVALADPTRRVLLAYGYQPDGSSPGKGGLPTFDTQSADRANRWATLAADNPADVTIQLNAGYESLRNNRYAEAAARFAAAIRAAPSEPTPQLGLGLAAFESGDYPKAIEAFERAGDLDPAAVEPLINRAICLEKLGRDAHALEGWRKLRPRVTDPRLAATLDDHIRDRESQNRK